MEEGFVPSTPMENYSFAVGQEFPDVKTFRRIIKEAAIAQHFELRIVKSDLIRYFAKCAKEGCPWRIRAVKLPNVPTFKIRSLEGTHTCGKNAQLGHHQASVDWIVAIIEERLRDNMNYKPKDILEDIQKQYGITIPYKQAWRAKERGLASIYGSSEEGYCLLPSYCEQIKGSNPGSVAQVFTTGADRRFHRVIVSFNALIHGFIHGCAPVLCLGALELKSKYLGSLLSITSFDADGGLFPVAYGIVDVETDDSWMWFLSEFQKLLVMGGVAPPQLTILSDGRRGIDDAVKRNFPAANHGVCLRYLTESMGREFKNSRLVHLLWKAGSSITTIAFRERMAEIEEVSADAARWIQKVPACRWAVPYIEGPRYGHLASNVEELSQWILDARELPIIQVMDRIHSKLMAEFKERSEKAAAWGSSILVPSAEKRMTEAVQLADAYRVLRSDEVEFEVLSADRSNIVNIGTRCCSCRDWQLHGIPCSHAAAAILSFRKDIHGYATEFFKVAKYQEAYSRPINPLPNKSQWSKAGEGLPDGSSGTVRPPTFRRPPGRPEKKRLCTEELPREKHIVHCSRCNQTGHYKRTCKAELIQSIEL
ncbi:unnamed protein product [Spirodela intermedia]|uniref:Uncharacterized protein n=2 Tax=Spirodela intermedia TaxID=51605 RepID=A0A7I8IIH3_SPIIN|nr:unnamed protein product [Spirodela intermedia]CAA6657675.1 unnamed protein product [Spirodela intermedia]CAA7393776.1 unnamed protein product [Spirodela intermedia]